MSENHCSLIIQGNVVPEYSISDLFENYNYSKNRFLNSIPRPLNLLKHYDVKKLGLERKKKDKSSSWIFPSTSGINVGPGSYYNNLTWVKEPNKKNYYFDDEKHSGKDNKEYNLPIFNFIQNNNERNNIIKRKDNKIKLKLINRSFSGKSNKEKLLKIFFHKNKNNINHKKGKIEYLPQKEIVSIFRSQSKKGIYFKNNHIPGPSYYEPKEILSKNFFKNTKKIWN